MFLNKNEGGTKPPSQSEYVPHSVKENYMKRKRTITDEDLQAVIDNSLSAEERRTVMEAVILSPILLDRMEELLRQQQLIKQSWVMFSSDRHH